MPFCPKCGAELPERSNFCSSCGTTIGAELTPGERARIRPRVADEREACFGPKGSGGGFWGAISGGVFLLGLVVLWYLDTQGILAWWPGILFLIAFMVIVGGIVAYSRRGY